MNNTDEGPQENDESKTNNQSDTKIDNPTLSRRKTLKLAGASGVIAGLNSIPAVAADNDDTVEITITKKGDCAAETREVPKEWYDHTKQSRDAKSTFMDDISEHSESIQMVMRGTQEAEIDGYKKHNIKVRMSEDVGPDIPDFLPDKVDGIPVEVEFGPRPQPGGCNDHYNNQPDPMIGGLRMDSSDSCGTICVRVKDYRGSQDEWVTRMLGARHLFTGICNDSDVTGNSWYQYSSTEVGEIDRDWQRLDAVLLDRQHTNRGFGDEIVNEGTTVYGRVTGDGLDCFKSKKTTLKKRGINTGLEKGEITDTSASDWYCSSNSVSGRVATNHNMNDGDSGGPTYYENNNGDLWLVMMNHTYSSDHTYGISAEHLNSEEGLWFGGNPNDGPCN